MVEIMELKTYKANEYLSYLADYLISNNKPFNFDGTEIEFTATTEFIKRMVEDDHLLSIIKLQEVIWE
ncbi:MAG: hypothetical protein J6L02_05675 [Bacteroidales bacterium]|nr:hypothetical protein [Bacteroidales bacterium]